HSVRSARVIGMASSQELPVVLVVESEPELRKFICGALEGDGFLVEASDTAGAASAILEQIKPDIILVDLALQHIGGLEACSILRALPGGLRVPILIMLDEDEIDVIPQAFERGASDFIMKPLNGGILSHRLRYAIRASRTLQSLAESESRLEQAQRIAHVGNWEWTLKTGQVSLSHELYRITGIRPGDFGGTYEAFLDLIHPDDRKLIGSEMVAAVARHTVLDRECRICVPNGGEIIVHLQAEIRRGVEGRIVSLVGTAQDITERKRSEVEIHRLAFFDNLTGLANRMLFKDRLRTSLAHAKRTQSMIAVMFLDLDRFKVINDTLGHNVGDLLLKNIATRLSESVRISDSVGRPNESINAPSLARLGGDEFTIVLTELEGAEGAATVAERIIGALAKPVCIDGREVFVTTSIGISLYPHDGETEDTLIKNADTAMYHAKESGRNGYQFYSASMNASDVERLALENDLRKACDNGELRLYYQPRIRLSDRRVTGIEALLRWQHPSRGLLMPSDFLPVAIESGLIRAIDQWVVKTACEQNRAWQKLGIGSLRVSVNISHSLFHYHGFIEFVRHALAEAGLDADCLELELTETTAMTHVDSSIAVLSELTAIGVHLSIDDFGTGYSSLSYLQRLSLNMVKIDQSFVKEIETNEGCAFITKAIISMAHSLNLFVLAEGVETEDQLAMMEFQGCDEVQGFYFSPPLPADALVEYVFREQTKTKMPARRVRPA
ncbi:MAG: EAL domain-containing protein, partial [Nitrospira sp.]|nr:EAL domain-containing protein [Nitrospira sp.]